MMKSKPRPLVTVPSLFHENSLVLNLFFLAAAHFRKFLKSSLSQGNMRIHRNNDFETYLRKPCNFYCCWWFAVSPLCPDFLILTVTVFQLTVPNCCSHCSIFFNHNFLHCPTRGLLSDCSSKFYLSFCRFLYVLCPPFYVSVIDCSDPDLINLLEYLFFPKFQVTALFVSI